MMNFKLLLLLVPLVSVSSEHHDFTSLREEISALKALVELQGEQIRALQVMAKTQASPCGCDSFDSRIVTIANDSSSPVRLVMGKPGAGVALINEVNIENLANSAVRNNLPEQEIAGILRVRGVAIGGWSISKNSDGGLDFSVDGAVKATIGSAGVVSAANGRFGAGQFSTVAASGQITAGAIASGPISASVVNTPSISAFSTPAISTPNINGHNPDPGSFQFGTGGCDGGYHKEVCPAGRFAIDATSHGETRCCTPTLRWS